MSSSSSSEGEEQQPQQPQQPHGSKGRGEAARPGTARVTKRKTISAKAGLLMPVTRIRRLLKSNKVANRVTKDAAIALAAGLEFLAWELLDLAAKAATDNKFRRIKPRHILLAIRNDEEFDRLLKDVVIPEGGVMPYIHPLLLPKRTVRPLEETSPPPTPPASPAPPPPPPRSPQPGPSKSKKKKK